MSVDAAGRFTAIMGGGSRAPLAACYRALATCRFKQWLAAGDGSRVDVCVVGMTGYAAPGCFRRVNQAGSTAIFSGVSR